MKKMTIQFDQKRYIRVDLIANLIHHHTRTLKFDFNVDLSNYLYKNIVGHLQKGYLNEGDVSKFMLRTVQADDVVVDVGANVGFYSLMLSTLVGTGGAVISFEPSVENVEAIQKNIETNNINNVDIRQKIIGEKSGQTSFFKYV